MQTGLIQKYNGLPKQIRASLWFVMSNVMIKGISFITLPIFSRLLTTEEYGVVSVYQSWLSIISIITTLTLWGGVYSVGLAKRGDKTYEMISAFQGLAFTITAAGLVVTLLLYPLLEPLLQLPRFLVICAFVDIVCQVPFNLWTGEQRYRYEYRKTIIITVIVSIMNPLLGYIAVINAEDRAEARIVSGLLVQMVLGIAFFCVNMKKSPKFFSREFWKWGFTFNIVLVPHYLSLQVLNQSDRIMISGLCGKSDAGIYSVAYTFAMLLSLVSAGVNSSLSPHIYQSIKSGDVSKLKKQTSAVIAVMAVIAVGIMAVVPDVFYLLLPDSYYPAMKTIPPVTAGAFFLFLYPLFGAVEFYFEKNRYVTYASVIGAVLNIELNYIFINKFGFEAAAYTTLFCYICFSACHFFFMKKVLRENGFKTDIYDKKMILAVSVFLTAFSVLMVLVYDFSPIRWAVIAAIAAVAFVKRKYLIETVRSLKNTDQ